MNKKNIVIICLILAAFLLYLVASQLAEDIFELLKVPVDNEFVLTIPQYIGIVIAGLAFAIVMKSTVAMEFFNDVAAEMAKVVYPTPKESAMSAGIVIFMVGIATVFLVAYDWVWTFVTTSILTIGS